MIVFENHPINKNTMPKSLKDKLDKMQLNYDKINAKIETQSIENKNNNSFNETQTSNQTINNDLSKLIPLINMIKDKEQNPNKLKEILLKNLGIENSAISSLLPLLSQMNNKNEQNKTFASSTKKEDKQISSYLKTDDYFID